MTAFSVAITDGLVEVDVGAGQAAAQLVAPVELDLGAEPGKGVDVRIEPAAADHVAARRRDARAAEPREQRPGEQERRADPAGERGVDLVGHELCRVQRAPRDRRVHSISAPRCCEQLEHRVDVADPRDVRQRHGLRGEQARREDRQDAVLVPGRHGRDLERIAAFDHERFRRLSDGGRGHGAHYG